MNKQEHEILSIAQEECAEVIQSISKIFRFGYDAKHPNESKNNQERLEEEIGDLQCMISLMLEFGLVREEALMKAEAKKFEKLKVWSNIFKEEKNVKYVC
jgi:NTP pyrophosphatase (non-canonical NTP hydrolase)